MPVLFLNQPGQAVALPDAGGDVGLPLAVDGIQGSWFPAFRAILTDLSVALDGNYQFLHTLRDVIYVYAFGDRISQLRIGGLAFAGGCGGGFTGVEAVLELYERNRVAVRADPIQVQIGVAASGRFRGYLTGFRAEILRPEARLAQFSLLLNVFPGGNF